MQCHVFKVFKETSLFKSNAELFTIQSLSSRDSLKMRTHWVFRPFTDRGQWCLLAEIAASFKFRLSPDVAKVVAISPFGDDQAGLQEHVCKTTTL